MLLCDTGTCLKVKTAVLSNRFSRLSPEQRFSKRRMPTSSGSTKGQQGTQHSLSINLGQFKRSFLRRLWQKIHHIYFALKLFFFLFTNRCSFEAGNCMVALTYQTSSQPWCRILFFKESQQKLVAKKYRFPSLFARVKFLKNLHSRIRKPLF